MDKRGEGSDKLLLKKTIQKKIRFLLKKPKVDPVESYNVVKKFFKVFFDKDYEYTREELVDELDKFYLKEDKKEALVRIILSLGRVEFAQPEFEQDELRNMLQTFSNIVESLVHAETKNLSFWDKVANRFKRKTEKEDEKKEKTQLDEFVEEVESDNDEVEDLDVDDSEMREKQEWPEPSEKQQDSENVDEATELLTEQSSAVDMDNSRFEEMLNTFYEELEEDVVEARMTYNELSQEYEAMSDDDKKLFYEQLVKAYEDLNERL